MTTGRINQITIVTKKWHNHSLSGTACIQAKHKHTNGIKENRRLNRRQSITSYTISLTSDKVSKCTHNMRLRRYLYMMIFDHHCVHKFIKIRYKIFYTDQSISEHKKQRKNTIWDKGELLKNKIKSMNLISFKSIKP